jgi:hypothetical protein
MSTGIGTLQPSQRRSLWPVAVVLSFVMLTVAVVVFSIDRGGSTPQAPAKQVAVEAPAAGIETGTAANTPSELRGAVPVAAPKVALTPHVPRRAVGPGGQQVSLGTTTPSEISGGMRGPTREEIRARELHRP